MNAGLQSNNPYLILGGGLAATVGTIWNAGWGSNLNTGRINQLKTNFNTGAYQTSNA